MGDVIHCLPAVTDMQRRFADLQLDWVVEENFAAIPRLHPSVGNVIPVAIRRWRKNLLDRQVHREFAGFRQQLNQNAYDLVLDAQGLLKSAWIGALVAAPSSGYDRHSIREPLASWFYRHRFPVARNLHAVTRNRQLAAAALAYPLDMPLDYGLQIQPAVFDWLTAERYLVALHATSRSDKEWPEPAWIELGCRLARQSVAMVLTWGNPVEQQRAHRLAEAIPGAIVAPRLDLADAAGLLAGAALVVGVDTGLTHMAAAVGTPVIALYCASEPGLTGVLGSGFHVNLGGNHTPPPIDVVWQQVQRVLQQ